MYRWRVSYSDGDKRKSKGFKTKTGKEGAQIFADKKRVDLDTHGKLHEAISDDERRAVMAFREIVGSLPESIAKPTLGEIVEGYRNQADVRRKSITVRELIDRYLNSLKKRELSDDYQYSTKLRLNKFEEDHGEWMACDISAEVVGDWLYDLDFAPLTVNHYRAVILQAFNYGVRIRAIESNPAEAVDKIKEKGKAIDALSSEQAADLLAHAPKEILPAVVIGLFAGLRRSEISRLDWSEVDFEQGHIEVKAKNAKSAARRLVPMRECLRAWLSLHRKSRGPVMPSEMIYRSRLNEARKAAGITDWPHNALRHSFASYNLAAFQNAPALAGEMGHGSTKMIFQHYRAIVTPKTAKKYWSLKPQQPGKVVKIAKPA